MVTSRLLWEAEIDPDLETPVPLAVRTLLYMQFASDIGCGSGIWHMRNQTPVTE